MYTIIKAFFIALLFLSTSSCVQAKQSHFRVMWYNVENLFDTMDDPKMNDEEFTPKGKRRWTSKRYSHKLNQIARVITAAGEWDTPAIVGLTEVENDSVMLDLLTRTPLRNQRYRYYITSGSDTRGINVAILYQRDKFAPVGSSSYPVRFREGRKKPTRDILHVSGRIITGDTLDIFALHFPSRSGGEKESEPYRMDAMETLVQLCDSVYRKRATPSIIVMGDFNDTAENESIKRFLCHPSADNAMFVDLPFDSKNKIETYKYQGEWSQLDHLFMNKELLNGNHPIHNVDGSSILYAPSFLFTRDKTHNGVRPKRSFYGFNYEAGFSDHLPLLIDFEVNP